MCLSELKKMVLILVAKLSVLDNKLFVVDLLRFQGGGEFDKSLISNLKGSFVTFCNLGS